MGTTDRITYALTLLFFLTTTSILSAQQDENDRATGQVVTMEGGKKSPLPGASVFWAGTTIGGATDTDGRFQLERTEGTDLLVVSFTGYVTDTVTYSGEPIGIILRTGVELGSVDVVSRQQSTATFLLDPLNVQRMDSKELRKAACCNLSESFETNASIDASFTDAVTGTRQIRMLGLSGRYSQILKDNIPNVRGLSTVQGLNYIPGDWIEDIHISKGAGSVTSGFESITGEINVAIKDPDSEERTHFNLYGNQGGRVEVNANHAVKVNDNWGTIALIHGEWNNNRRDGNGDGFMDNPLKQDFVLRNQWKWRADEHWEGQYAVTYLEQHQESGQLDYDSERRGEHWGMHLDGQRLELSAKTGYLLDDAWGSSFGSQFSFVDYQLDILPGMSDYRGSQRTFRGNLLYATKLGCESRALTVGVSALIEDYEDRLDDIMLDRQERVFGAYGEFTWNPTARLSTIIGLRGDEHNLFGTMVSPRLHLRYSITDDLSLKGAAGRGYRTANPITDNLGLLASSREWMIDAPLTQESGWNFGANATYKFRLDYRDASLAVDAYTTRFDELAVIDQETPGEVSVYALDGESYANTAQVEFGWEAMRRFDMRIAYRYTDAKTDFQNGLLDNPFNPTHRGFINLAYETKKTEKEAQWQIDGTMQLIGEQRLPDSYASGVSDQVIITDRTTPNFIQVHGQVTRTFKKGVALYVGVENATDYRQDKPINGYEDPFGETFDASQVWAPVFGRMVYGGLRWTM